MKTREMHRSSVRRTALLLFLSMLLSVFTFFPSYAVTENDTETENTATEPEQIESEEQIFARITADSFLLNYIDEDSFRATGHVNRLPEEEDLNSYVFENADGTRTAYILAEPVKYVDSTGAVKEKNLTLSTGSIGNASVMAAAVNTNAYTVTDTNTPMTFPNDLSQGVSFTYGEYTVTLCPETVNTAATVMQADGKVLYRNAFGTTAHLMYTPQLNGLKEDIVLTSYNGTNSFSFILNTDGLIPASDAGGYYLWDGNTPETQIRLGQVVSYDTNGDFSIGEMTVEQTSGTHYRVTLTVDENFLENAVYPVTVDPTLTVTYEDDKIIDAPVFAGIPNANFGTFQYNSVGYTSSTYGQAMTAVKLPGLYNSTTFQTAADFQISSAKFYIKEASGTASQTINLYPITTDTAWNEISVKWNTLTNGYDTAYTCTAALASNATVYFDITDLVVKWINGTYTAESGFVLTVNNATANKQFHSCESSNTAARPYVVMDYNYGIISTDNKQNITISVEEQYTISVQVKPESATINWSSSDTSVATVDSEGVITGVGIGTATITATATFTDDESSYDIATRNVTVVLADGIYTIDSEAKLGSTGISNYYLYSKNLASTENIYPKIQIASITTSTLETQFKRRWRIIHVGNGEYVLYSMADLDNQQALSIRDNNITLTPVSNPTNSSNTLRWYIQKTGTGNFGYEIVSKADTTKVLTASTSEEQLGTSYYRDSILVNSESTDVYSWRITKSPMSGLLFRKFNIDASGQKVYTDDIIDSFSATVSIETTLTLESFGYEIMAYGNSLDIEPTITWRSLKPSAISVNSTSGVASVITLHELVTLQAVSIIDGIECTASYNLTVTGLENGVYYMRNYGSKLFAGVYGTTTVNLRLGNPSALNTLHWNVSHYENGYYFIWTEFNDSDLYLISQNNNLSLCTSNVMSYDMLFSILPVGDEYTIEPYSFSNFAVSASDALDNDGFCEMNLENRNTTSNYQKWKFIPFSDSNTTIYCVTAEAMYDKGYEALYDAASSVESLMWQATNFYFETFGIYFDYTIAQTATESLADKQCPGNNGSELDMQNCTVCDQAEHHAAADDMARALTKSRQIAILFSGHDLCTGENDGNESPDVLGVQISLAEELHTISSVCVVEKDDLSTVVHELGHVFGAPDHYGSIDAPTTDEMNELDEDDSAYIPNDKGIKYDAYCLYGERNTSTKSTLKMCAGCKYQINVFWEGVS